MLPDIYGRSLRRALDLKVKKLRSLLTADEDITTELDRIVCRLMKLALRTSKDHHSPPPTSWMQRKLLDLLSLTEKAIERKRKYSIENYPMKAIGFDRFDSLQQKIKDDDIADKIVDKYLMLSADRDNEQFVVKSEVHYTEDNLSATSNEIDPFILEPRSTYGEVRLESMKSESKEEIRLEITQAWVDGDFDLVSPTDDYVVKSNVESSLSSTSNDSQYRYDKSYKNTTLVNKKQQYGSDLHVNSKNKLNRAAKISKIKGRQSKNKLIKKLSKKRSNSGQLARKYSKKIEFVEYKSYTINKPKRDFKGQYNLQSNSSKPIPRSLIELCYQDLSAEKSEKLINSSICNDNNIVYSPGNVAATKECLFIDIVTEDVEETIALRRTIATEVDHNSDMESEAILETVINVTKDDSFEYVGPMNAFNSETIFLNDLNEPSTSKGIRHVSADAQCGTDILALCPTPSSVSSLMNTPNICETGIKIGDSFMNLEFHKNSINFGTLTDENIYSNFMSVFKKQPIKIKDSDTNLTKNVDCSTMTHDNYLKLDADITLFTPISGFLQAKDSPSELGVYNKLSKSRLNCPKNTSDIRMSQKISVTKHVRPKLSCCGIHVHSYRDRQISEDIVFQGEWQRNGPKILARKSPCAHMMSRKRDTSVKKKNVELKEKVCPRQQDKKTKVTENKFVTKQNIKYTKTNQEIATKDYRRSFVASSLVKQERNNKNVTKVASKIFTSIMPSRSIKNIHTIKNKPVLKYTNIKHNTKNINKSNDSSNFTDNKKKPVIKVNKLNRSAEYANSPIIEKTVPSFIRSKTEDLKDKLLKFNNENNKNLTYLVFRNEIENSRSANSSSANSKALTKLNNSKNNYSPPSQNSSPCSSPNSIATVRAFSGKTNTNCNKKNSSSPEKGNQVNISTESFEIGKNKKYIKNTNSTKLVNSSLSYENKENLPETSKKFDKRQEDKSSKVIGNDRNKKVFMLQVKTDSPPSMTRKKSDNNTQGYNSSNTKLLKNKDPDQQRLLTSSSFNKITSNKKSKSPIRSTDEKPEINNLTRSSTPILDTSIMSNVDEQECTNIRMRNVKSNIRRSNSKINAAMKQLIEESLSSFINKVQDKNESDSDTVILARDSESLNESSSPVSYKTVINNDNTCNISGSDLENALFSYSFESDLENRATLGSSHSRLTSIDTDLLSFRSTEYCTNNDLDSTLVPQDTSNTKTVRDIFERKDQHIVKNTGGVIAVQVFSGFSMDGEPVVGDQPEYISLVDPETGNLALEMTRQVTSEELFVSGRSSDTYESCNVEDDTFVPNWLFHIISQQQSFHAEIPEEPEGQEFPDPFEPPTEPEYDANGNMMEPGFGAGVGAGDGRGMHSDQSQDSSGRGTSISSSDVSSEPQSEAVLIDPSAFLTPANTVPMIGPTLVPVESSDTSFRTVETTEMDNEARYTRENSQRRMNRVPAASDVDADVSSLETDAADSDN